MVALAFTIKGLTGFGAGLLMVPLLALFMDVKTVVPLMVAFAAAANVLLLATFHTRRSVSWSLLPPMLVAGGAGLAVGTYILASYRSEQLEALCGLFIAAYAAHRLWSGTKEGSVLAPGFGWLAGLASGLIGGMFGTGGPPVVMYLSRQLPDKRAFRATLTFYFLIMDATQLGALRVAGLIGPDVLRLALYLLPAFVLGSVAGSLLHLRIGQLWFDRVVAVLLLVTAGFLVF